MRTAYVKALADEAVKNKNIFGIVADIGTFTFDYLKEKCPERFLNVGIAECNMVGMAAGMALEGKIPFVYTITPFLTARALEPIRVDACYQKLNVKLVGCGSGYSYSTLGATHHATDDIALMRALPEMTVISPADPQDVSNAVKAAIEHKGPVYIRIGRDGEPKVNPENYEFKLGKAVTVREGNDFTIIGAGSLLSHALEAADILAKENINIRIINMHTIKPIDEEAILKAAKETRGIVTLEEHTIIGGLGGAVSEVLAENFVSLPQIPFKRIGLNDCFCIEYGTPQDLDKWCGLTSQDVVKVIKSLI